MAKDSNVGVFLAEQRKFFREVYGKNLPAKIVMPSVRIGFDWGLIMRSFMMPQYLFDCSLERFGKAWKWTNEDLNTMIVHSDRDAKRDGVYGGWCRDRVEADEEYRNCSYNQIVMARIKGMTVAERLNLGLWFHWKTGGKHLDFQSITLASGSRFLGGDVPCVCWHNYGSELYIPFYGPNYANDRLRTREVIVSN